jgi:putative transposase
VRQWCLKFGQDFAKQLRHRQGKPGDTWHLDELVTIAGGRHYLWRAVNQDGDVRISSCRNGGILARPNAFFTSC